jgi:hypothetical protein
MFTTRNIAVIVLVVALATSGVVAGVYDVSTGGDEGVSTDDRAASGAATQSSVDRIGVQQDEAVTEIESGETVTGEVNRSQTLKEYSFEMDPGERATVAFTLDAPRENDTRVTIESPSGERLDRATVRGGETHVVNVTAKVEGTATVTVDWAEQGFVGGDGGPFTFTLTVESADTLPAEPNDDRANATVLDPNQTVSAGLDGADVDYYTFTLFENRSQNHTRSMEVPVTVTVDRQAQDGVSVLNVETAPADGMPETTTRYVGTGTPTSVRFVGTGGNQYYVAVANVEAGAGPYDLTVTVNRSAAEMDPTPPAAGEQQSLEAISQAAYGIAFDDLSDPTSHLVRTVHDRQDSPTKLSKDELSRMHYDMPFAELSEETRGEITTLYRAQFVDERG